MTAHIYDLDDDGNWVLTRTNFRTGACANCMKPIFLSYTGQWLHVSTGSPACQFFATPDKEGQK